MKVCVTYSNKINLICRANTLFLRNNIKTSHDICYTALYNEFNTGNDCGYSVL